MRTWSSREIPSPSPLCCVTTVQVHFLSTSLGLCRALDMCKSLSQELRPSCSCNILNHNMNFWLLFVFIIHLVIICQIRHNPTIMIMMTATMIVVCTRNLSTFPVFNEETLLFLNTPKIRWWFDFCFHPVYMLQKMKQLRIFVYVNCNRVNIILIVREFSFNERLSSLF